MNTRRKSQGIRIARPPRAEGSRSGCRDSQIVHPHGLLHWRSITDIRSNQELIPFHVRVNTGAHDHVALRNDESAVVPIFDLPVGPALAIRDAVELEPGFHMVPIALVVLPGTVLEITLLGFPRFAVPVHRARSVTIHTCVTILANAVAPRHRSVLRNGGEVLTDA